MSELERATLNDVVAKLDAIKELLEKLVPLDLTSTKITADWTPPGDKPKVIVDSVGTEAKTGNSRNVIGAPPRAAQHL